MSHITTRATPKTSKIRKTRPTSKATVQATRRPTAPADGAATARFKSKKTPKRCTPADTEAAVLDILKDLIPEGALQLVICRSERRTPTRRPLKGEVGEPLEEEITVTRSGGWSRQTLWSSGLHTSMTAPFDRVLAWFEAGARGLCLNAIASAEGLSRAQLAKVNRKLDRVFPWESGS